MGKEKGSQLEIRLSRYNRVYQPGEIVSGQATVSTNGGLAHSGIHLKVEGSVTMQLSASAVGLFEAFSSNLKPLPLIALSKEVQPPGKLADGKIAIPFEFSLQPLPGTALLDTYHGVFICIQYTLAVEVLKSGLFGQNIVETTEFIVEVPTTRNAPARIPAPFLFSSDSVKKSRGKIVVKESSRPISAISLQLIRVESITLGDGNAKEASEVQCVQVARGHVLENLEIPVHVVMPRLFTAPSIHEKQFQLDFEVNFLVEFDNGFVAIENIPLKIWR